MIRRILESPLLMSLRGEFARGVLKLGGGTVLGQAILLLATPAITRLYTPADMGLLGLLVSFFSVAGVVLGGRYDMAIVSAGDEREADCLLAVALLAVVPLTLLAGGVLATMIGLDWLTYGSLPMWSLGLALPALAMTGIFSALRFWHVRSGRYGAISRAVVLQGAGRGLVPVGVGWWQPGWVGLLLGEVAGRLLGVFRLGRTAWPALRGALRPWDGAYFRRVLAANWKYPGFVLPSSLLDALGAALPLPVVARLYGSAAAGEYLLVTRLVSLPAGLVSASVADVFHSRLAEACRTSPEQARPLLRRVSVHLLGIGLAIFVPAAAVAPWVFGPVFGSAWDRAGRLLAVLAPLALAGLVISPVSRLLLTVGRQADKLMADVAMVVAPLAGLFLGQALGYPFLGAMMVCVGFQLLAYAFYYGLIWRASRQGKR
jgi:O-antigen/teichoic acid export membrane protein